MLSKMDQVLKAKMLIRDQAEQKTLVHALPVKPHKTFEEQLALLKERGLVIVDEQKMLGHLQHLGYYHLSGYTLTLVHPNGIFLSGTTSDELISLYAFDHELRTLLRVVLDRIEVSFRTYVSYAHTSSYGSIGYDDHTTMRPSFDHDGFMGRVASEIYHQRRIPIVSHHLKDYDGNFPLWVLMEILTFGQVSTFYQNMYARERKKVSKQYGSIDIDTLKSFASCISELRNVCAHQGRLYYRIFTSLPSFSSCNKIKASYTQAGLNEWRLFWQLYPVIKMLPLEEQRESFINGLRLTIERYKCVHLDDIGFPPDWESVLRSL